VLDIFSRLPVTFRKCWGGSDWNSRQHETARPRVEHGGDGLQMRINILKRKSVPDSRKGVVLGLGRVLVALTVRRLAKGKR
jgi:hypothetical protein